MSSERWSAAAWLDDSWSYPPAKEAAIREALDLDPEAAAAALGRITSLAQEYHTLAGIVADKPRSGETGERLRALNEQARALEQLLGQLDQVTVIEMAKHAPQADLYSRIRRTKEDLHVIGSLAEFAEMHRKKTGGRPRAGAQRSFVRGLVSVWRECKGEPPRGWDFTGSFADFMRACFKPVEGQDTNLQHLVKDVLSGPSARAET